MPDSALLSRVSGRQFHHIKTLALALLGQLLYRFTQDLLPLGSDCREPRAYRHRVERGWGRRGFVWIGCVVCEARSSLQYSPRFLA